MSTEPLSNNIEPLTLSDTVYTWYNTTNEIIDLINPLNIYDVIPENGLSSQRSGISDGILTLQVNLKSSGGLAFEENGSISLSTVGLQKESFSTASSYKLFAEDSSGNIKAITFDLNSGTGIQFTDNTNALTIGIDNTVVTLTGTQTLTNKSLFEPKIINSSSSPTGIITLKAPANTNYSITLPSSYGAVNQILSSDGFGNLIWADASSGSGSGTFSFRGEGAQTDTTVNLTNQYLNFVGTTGINTVSGVVNGIPRLEIGIDTTVVTVTRAQTLLGKTLEDVKIIGKDVSNYVTLKSSPSSLTNYTLTLPVNAGTNGQYLKTNGTGILSWDTPSGLGGSTTFYIDADIGEPVVFDTSTDTLSIEGSSLINTEITGTNIEISLNDSAFAGKFSAGDGLGISNPGGVPNIRYSLLSTISNKTLNQCKFSNIFYSYGDNEYGVTDKGPLYTLMSPDWDETQTENGHIEGQLVLVPFAD